MERTRPAAAAPKNPMAATAAYIAPSTMENVASLGKPSAPKIRRVRALNTLHLRCLSMLISRNRSIFARNQPRTLVSLEGNLPR